MRTYNLGASPFVACVARVASRGVCSGEKEILKPLRSYTWAVLSSVASFQVADVSPAMLLFSRFV